MHIQSSHQFEQSSCLYLVGTPIGNLEDMTFRAIRILKEVDVIAAEDTRNTKKLCHYFEIDTPLVSYHAHNEEAGGAKLLNLLKEGKSVALVSDAGMPCISDPGDDLVRKALAEGFAVVPVPGANAALTALIASGIPAQPFTFYGFLPRGKKERKAALELLLSRTETTIYYEAPHRLKEVLAAIQEVLGGERQIVLARELTKKFEEFIRGTVDQAIEWATTHEIRGEFCVVVAGTSEQTVEANKSAEWWEELDVKRHVETLMLQKDLSSKQAIKEVATARQVNKRDVYAAYHLEGQ
ncbi:16S rRNA (cytidine(1402)-2'-O)-methyltransferase [Chryseomicrobium sp. FSL W7-1435]|uniref:16S rRNA (cytidine(1402)-2'-O)-methyltransferase n=1 Tax=Chryseomicrobium sp. FSL W7-1435 TaxID=2921704 RepID=UPI00315ACD38